MDDYISREAALARLRKIVEVNRLRTDRAWFTPDGVEYLINEIPAADVRPVKEGKNITENNPVDEFVCSKCGIILEDWSRVEIDEDDGEITNHEYVFRFCPNCGEKMGGADG